MLPAVLLGQKEAAIGGRLLGKLLGVVVEPVLAVKAVQADAPPFDPLKRANLPFRNDPHNDQGRAQNLPDVTQVDRLGEACDVLALHGEVRQVARPVARNHKEKHRGADDDAGSQSQGGRDQGLLDGLAILLGGAEGALRSAPGGFHAPLDLVTDERGDGTEDVNDEEDHEGGADGEDGAGQHHQEGQRRQVAVVAISAGGEDFHHGREQHQMDRGRKQAVERTGAGGENQKIEQVKEDVEDGNPRDRAGSERIINSTDIAPEPDAERREDHDDGREIQPAGRRDRQEACGQHQQQRDFKVTLDADVRLISGGRRGVGLGLRSHGGSSGRVGSYSSAELRRARRFEPGPNVRRRRQTSSELTGLPDELRLGGVLIQRPAWGFGR